MLTASGRERIGRMNRLTGDFKGVSMFATVEQALQYNRLRRYEDTGLTPEEIVALRAEVERLRNSVSMLETDRINLTGNLEHMTAEVEQYQSDIEAGRMIPATTCTWTEDADGIWTCSDCEIQYSITDGGRPEENEILHCPRCGRKIEKSTTSDEAWDECRAALEGGQQ